MRVLILSLLIVIADQVSKVLVKGISLPWLGISLEGMQYGSSRQIVGDFLRLTYIENPGMAFGIDLGGKLIFSIFSVLASIAILVYLYKAREESFALRMSLAMILGGAIGNLIDRVFYGVIFGEAPLFHGKVVDFFDIDFFNIDILGYHLSRWPVFNVADAAVTTGVVLLLFFHRSTETEELTPVPVTVDPPASPQDPPGSPNFPTDQQ